MKKPQELGELLKRQEVLRLAGWFRAEIKRITHFYRQGKQELMLLCQATEANLGYLMRSQAPDKKSEEALDSVTDDTADTDIFAQRARSGKGSFR